MSSPAAPVAIVGNLNLDVRTSPIGASGGILEDGETSVESIYESLGGGAANTAVAAALMGAEVHLCCAVGRDELGRRLCAFLEERGVRVHPAVKPVETGRSLALTWDTHHRHFLSSLPHARLLEESDVDIDLLRRAGCRHFYRADVWFADRLFSTGNISLLRRAREAGMETSLDVNWDPLWMRSADAQVQGRIAALRPALAHVSFVHGNERELAFFTGTGTARAAAARLMEWGAAAVIVHRGPHGCSAATIDGWLDVPAETVTRVVNETGTGDVFTAAFLVTGGLPLEERLRRSAAAAARHLRGSPSYAPHLDGAISTEPAGR